MEVKIISSDMIRPVSPTPPHLRYFNLNYLDQLSPHMFIHLILYYPRHEIGKATTTTADISRRLKTSLSESLVQFYPLAGKLVAKENQIECNDKGVEFYETRVLHSQLQELLKEPNKISLSELVPCYMTCTKHSGREDAVLAVQANFFDCGGLALGVSLSHLIADAASLATFLNGWASTAAEGGGPGQQSPLVVHQHLFPQIPGLPRPLDGRNASNNTKMKRFVIDEFHLLALRRKNGCAATRVEAVTALVSRCLARAARKTSVVDVRDDRGFMVTHPVNLRRRMEPPLPDDAFGNFCVIVAVSPEGSPADDQKGGLEVSLRDTFKNVDAAFVKELQGPDGYKKAMEFKMALLEKNKEKETSAFAFTSWCKFGYYEVDFGWGKPQLVSPAQVPLKNLFLFLDQKEGDGVEVWANMDAEDMIKFEQDQELLSYVYHPYD